MDETNKSRKRTSEEAWVMSSFTDDLWTEIFLHLPIKSLLQFKSVSKSWFSIISSHRFAKSHLALAAKDDQLLIVQHKHRYILRHGDGSFSLCHLDSCGIFKNLNFPYSQGEYTPDSTSSILIGSDCGIVCVSVDLTDWRAAKKKLDIYLWNPATKHSKLIPSYTIPDEEWTFSSLGLGFDHIDLDFKVVRVVVRLVSSTVSAEVYSSNKNDWREIECKLVEFPYMNSSYDVCCHGFLFSIYTKKVMMAFDLNKEFFIWDIKLPVSSFDASYIESRVTDFMDTIAVIFSNMDEGRIQLWTLDDEACLSSGGVIASWTKVLTVDVGVPLDYVEGLFNKVQVSIVDTDAHRFLYDLNKKATTNFPVPPYLETSEINKYTESLFSLVGFRRIKWDASSQLMDSEKPSSSRLQDSSDSDSEMD